MRADKSDASFVGRSGTAGGVTVALRRRQGQAGEGVDVPVGTAFATFQSVVVRCE